MKKQKEIKPKKELKPFKPEPLKCSRCKKNNATMTYANSIMDYTHGLSEYICVECYEKIKKSNPWYQEGAKDNTDKIVKIIDKILQRNFIMVGGSVDANHIYRTGARESLISLKKKLLEEQIEDGKKNK